MLVKRVIPCLDVAAGRVVKGVNFKSLKDAGDPIELAKFYKTKNQILYYSTETIPAYVPKQKQKIEIENSNQLAKKSIETVIWFLKSKESSNICNIHDKWNWLQRFFFYWRINPREYLVN